MRLPTDWLVMQAPIVEGIVESLRIGVGFLWTAAWAIIMGLVVTSLVQVYVSKERMARVLGDGDLTGLTKATLFGAASSGCSFGAVAIGKGLFKKGAHTVNFLAFMFASTNLIVELGLMILILLGWEFRCRTPWRRHSHRRDGGPRPSGPPREPLRASTGGTESTRPRPRDY